MKHLSRYKFHLAAILVLLILILVGARTKTAQVSRTPDSLPSVDSNGQLIHALELLPADSSRALSGSGTVDLRPFILSYIQARLPEHAKDRAFEIAYAVIRESNHHHMDPLFLLAVISTESQFNTYAIGSHGEIGLMQILPKTALWLAPQAGFRLTAQTTLDLADPSTNIRLGATYFARLRLKFNRQSKRYVAAYNMGSANVRRLLASNVEPHIYPSRVLTTYSELRSKSLEFTTSSTQVLAQK